jgi:hypothetical protein
MLLQESGIKSQVEVCPTESVSTKLYHLYLPLRNAFVHLTNTAILLWHYASGQDRSRPSTSGSTNLSRPISSSIETESGPQTVPSVNAMSNIGLEPSKAAGDARTTAMQQTNTLPGSQKDYVLLCSEERGWLTTWEDLDVSKIRSDKELFEIFRRRVNERSHWARRFASLKTIQRISFVKVSKPL